MPGEETEQERDPSPFRLLRRCDEVEPRLGRLYESWNVDTGRPALTLFPRGTVEWQPMEAWRGWIFFDPTAHCVSLELERGLATEVVTESMNVLTLLTLAGQRVEDSAQTNAHFVGHPSSRLKRWGGLARLAASSRRGWLVAGVTVLALALGLWHDRVRAIQCHEQTPGGSPTLAEVPDGHTLVPAYPMPDKPFPDQGVPPCVTEQGGIEIKGGCWIELARKPPCYTFAAEQEGKCYLPMPKVKPLPRSFKP